MSQDMAHYTPSEKPHSPTNTGLSAPAWISLSSDGVPMLIFALQSGFKDGYENELEGQSSEGGRAHYPQITRKYGFVKDTALEIHLAVGASDSIGTPQELVARVESLYDLALPESGGSGLPTLVHMSVGGRGSIWFNRRYVVKSIDVEFMAPWDTDTGLAMQAKVSLVMKPHFGSSLVDNCLDDNLPQRHWKFNKADYP